MKAWSTTLLLVTVVTAVEAAPLRGATYSFERKAVGEQGPKFEGDAHFSADTPGRFTYDPLAKKSRPNEASLDWKGGEPLAAKMPKAGVKSYTLETFVKPLGASDASIARKSRVSDAAVEFGVKLDHFNAHNQFYLRGFVALPKSGPEAIFTGYYGSSAQFQGDEDRAWRHVAIVVDGEKKTATSYVDYYLSSSIPLDGDLSFDDGALLIGDNKLVALVDEVRLTPKALRPAHFLRATNEPLEGLSFESSQTIAPPDAGCLDIKEHFGAVGDGRTDDTAAFQKAFRELCSRVPLAYNTLLVPEGTYLITEMIQGGRFIDVKGAGPGKTILKLQDGVFIDRENPRPVLRMSSSQAPPGSYDGVNGSSISIYVDGLTIDTGRGNPGARGIEFHSNNVGRLENVVIQSGDGEGICGLDLTHHDCGPALVKNVSVIGFDYGVQSRYQEYSMTFEHLRLEGQRVAGILNEGNILAIRKLTSKNSVPAIVSSGANSMVALIDSELLKSGDADGPAIRSEGALYALRVKSDYDAAVIERVLGSREPKKWETRTFLAKFVHEEAFDTWFDRANEKRGALKLPIEETPEAPTVPLPEWVNVLDFEKHKQGDDWGPAVQAAIDRGARVIYCPANHGLGFATPVVLRGRVERIVGYGNDWRWLPEKYSPPDGGAQREQSDAISAPPPLVVFNDPDPKRTVWLDRLCVHSIEHASQGTLVLRSSSPERYVTGAAGGKLFAEDVGGADWHFDHPQQVWVRQWNPESHASGPCIHSQGATIWALGFKTEYESQKLLAEKGAATEILGAFIYPIGKIPEDRPIFENRDSRMSLVYGASVYHSNHNVHIRDTRQGETREVKSDRLRWAGSRARMDLYTTE